MTTVAVLGARGRTGSKVVELLQSEFTNRAKLAAAPRRGENLDALLEADVLIDFSSPEAMSELAKNALSREKPPAFVVGSTGWKLDDRKNLEALCAKTEVLMSANFSLGVAAMAEILKFASPMLERLGYTPVIVETHHLHKKDRPSGTALSLQRAISPAGPGNVQTHSVRAGEVIGDHKVTYYGTADQITVFHHAQERSIFARGAIEVALWLAERRNQPPSGKLLGMETFFKNRTEVTR